MKKHKEEKSHEGQVEDLGEETKKTTETTETAGTEETSVDIATAELSLFYEEDILRDMANFEAKLSSIRFPSSERKRLGILAAMVVEGEKLLQELRTLARKLQAKEEIHPFQGKKYFSFQFSSFEVFLVICGVGTNNATLAAQSLVDRFACDHLLHTGIAGALHKDLRPLDFVLASETAYDTSKGMGYVYSYPWKEQYTGCSSFSTSQAWRKEMKALFPLVQARLQLQEENIAKVYEGLVVSSDVFIGDLEQKRQTLTAYPEAYACEMEGAATARVAYISCIPYMLLRCISDTADSGFSGNYEMFEAKAAEASAQWCYLWVLKSLGLLHELHEA